MLKSLLALSLCLGSLLSADRAQAQAYPDHPIKMVVPFPAGGPTDGMARIVADRLGATLGQSIVVENKGGGAGGSIGAKFVASSEPDGYTILITPGGSLTTGPAVHKNIGYDPVKAFVPVAQLIETPLVISVHPSLPVKSMAELIALAKKRPGQINYASSGNGTPPHLAAEMFKVAAGIAIVHVPYKGAGQAMIDLVGGQVQMAFAIVSAAMPQVQAGKVRALGITSLQTSPLAPDLPTLSQLGLAGFDVRGWNGFVAPAGTPRAVVARINAEAMRALKQPEIVQRLKTAGYEAAAENSPEQFADFIKSELAKWTRVVKESGAKVD